MNFNLKEFIKGILVICSYFMFTIILSIPFIFLIESNKISENTANFFIYLGLSIIYIIIYHKTLKENIKDFKSNYKTILKSTLKYWAIGLGIMLLSSLIISLFQIPTNTNQDANIELFKQTPILQTICVILFAPITEELVFRRSFNKMTNNKLLFSLITGIIFGLLHVTSSINSAKDLIMLIYLIPYSSVGIALGYAYKKHNNIIGTMTIHALHNIISVIEILILL